VVSASSDRLAALAARDDVAWVEDFVLRKKHNDTGGGVIMGAALAHGLDYTGSTQTVALADTGIGDGTPTGAHPSIPANRIAAIYNWPGVAGGCFQSIVNDGPRDVDSGHGTHTSVSVLGGGDANGKGKGTAPGARLVLQAVEDWANISPLCQILYGYPNGYYLAGLPTDLRSLFQQAYTAGARIHSDSWGSDVNGQYTTDSLNTDDFVWGHRDMTITFSAGNAGTDADGNGGVDGDSMGAPATAKNVLSVGASENARTDGYPCDASKDAVCASQGGLNQVFTYGSAWPFDFGANPLKDDPSAGNADQMAAFSSRGPTDDGRIKPDVVAPGTWLLSGYSGLYRSGYDPAPNPQSGFFQYDGWGYPLSGGHKYMGGTSMSTPLVAGGAAVVRDYYQKVHGHAASAALVKATLVNSAVDLLDENNDGVNDNALAIPNFYEGWGRVDLAAATDGSREFREDAAGLQTNETRSYTFTVSAGTPFKVTLSWSDYRGTSSATKMLVNDLDLEVAGPGGVLHKGNVFGRGWSATGGLRDNTNNLENVFVQYPAAGTWTVTVKAYNVPQGPQPFAVVAAGLLQDGPADASPSVTLTSPSEGALVSGTATMAADASDDVAVSRVDFYVDASLVGSDTSAPYSVSWNTTLTPNGAHVAKAVAVDSAGQAAEDTSAVTVQNAVASRTHVADLDATSGRYNSNRWRADVAITVKDDLEQPVAGATVRGAWSRGTGGTTSCVTGAAGTCAVWRTIANSQTSVNWTVTSVTRSGLTYDPAANRDPDGDSNGTTITVRK
jgi:subtilisin family serine protease